MKSQISIHTDEPAKARDLVKALMQFHGDSDGKAHMLVQVCTESDEVAKQVVMLFPGQTNTIRQIKGEVKELSDHTEDTHLDDPISDLRRQLNKGAMKEAKALKKNDRLDVGHKQLVCAGCGDEITSPLKKAIRCPVCLKAGKAQPANCLAFNGQLYAREYLLELLNKNTFQPGTRFTNAKGKEFAAIKDSKLGWQLQKV